MKINAAILAELRARRRPGAKWAVYEHDTQFLFIQVGECCRYKTTPPFMVSRMFPEFPVFDHFGYLDMVTGCIFKIDESCLDN